MNFFVMDGETLRLKTSPMVWIYVLSSIALTGATGILYYFVTRRERNDNSVDIITPNETEEPEEYAEKRMTSQFSGLRKRLQGGPTVSPPPGV